MKKPVLKFYNTLNRELTPFHPIRQDYVGVYLCGPTVYGDPHLGHARSAVIFDVLVRTLRAWDYKVRYVRNITDVGHLIGDRDFGEDKIGAIARKQDRHPMQVAQHYTDLYLSCLDKMNVQRPDIMPLATGHISEQIDWIKGLLAKGYAYAVNGSVYFDLVEYTKTHKYGILAGRKIDEQQETTRYLVKTSEKRNHIDFALWKKGEVNHLMCWSSPWGMGFPGWHIECSVMSDKYLGVPFDIHGGGLDLAFPHHACERAQTRAFHACETARYWIHHNMVTLEGKKMSKSAKNFVSLPQLFTGSHPLLQKSYHPLIIRYFLLSAHYRSVLNFSNEALQAAEKGYYKLLNGYKNLNDQLIIFAKEVDTELVNELNKLCDACYEAITYDLNTAKLLGSLFELLKFINTWITLQVVSVDKATYLHVKFTYLFFFETVLGLQEVDLPAPKELIHTFLHIYSQAKKDQNYVLVDQIRQALISQGISIQDTKNNVNWSYQAVR